MESAAAGRGLALAMEEQGHSMAPSEFIAFKCLQIALLGSMISSLQVTGSSLCMTW